MKSYFKKSGIILTLCILIFISSCTSAPNNTTPVGAPLRDTRTDLLGTVTSLTLYDTVEQAVFDEAFSIVSDIDKRMSVNRADSEISSINMDSDGDFVPVSTDTYELIKQAVDFSDSFGGTFDITIGAVVELWKSGETFSVLPDESDIRNKLSLINYRDISFDENGVRLNKPGMKLDLGSIAKGYACDKTVEYLKSRKVTSALLDFGGNIYAHGTKPGGSSWSIGIRNPIIGENDVVCSVNVQNTSVVTSGVYERYFEENGKMYHHLLDPKTGYPVDNGLLSVTIVDVSSTRADALSTACFVLGLENGYALIESLPESEAIFITENNTIFVTSGLAENVSLLDTNFQISPTAP